ncbi:hypothetical protein, partial [Mycobacterium sp. 94-17]|uniref:hypothetical protein n=1 Tax=Mycobacterium sp. 94-17 TaxID=2986147 RepID=UPI002D1F416D
PHSSGYDTPVLTSRPGSYTTLVDATLEDLSLYAEKGYLYLLSFSRATTAIGCGQLDYRM